MESKQSIENTQELVFYLLRLVVSSRRVRNHSQQQLDQVSKQESLP